MGLTVEFVGPAGVGKTTLVNRFAESAAGHGWMRIKDLSGSMPSSGELPDFADWEKRLLELRLFRLTKERNTALNFYAFADLAYRHAIMNVLWRNSQPPMRLIADEHLLLMMTLELKDWLTFKDPALDHYLANRAFVFVEDSPKAITDRVFQRMRSGVRKPALQDMSESTLSRHCKSVMKVFAGIRSQLQTVGAPVLTLDYSEDAAVLDDKLVAFITSLGR